MGHSLEAVDQRSSQDATPLVCQLWCQSEWLSAMSEDQGLQNWTARAGYRQRFNQHTNKPN